MQLAEAEALGALYYHHAGVGHVHPDFDNRRGNQYLGPSRGKCSHIEVLDFGGLLPVDYRHFVVGVGETFKYFLITHLQVVEVHLLAFEYKWIHHEYLAPQRYLLAHEIIYAAFLGVGYHRRLHRLAPGRHLVYHRYVQIPVKGHGQGSGDRGCRHYQHVRGNSARAFGP